MQIQNNKSNSTSFKMKFVPKESRNKEKLVRGLHFLTGSGKRHYDSFKKQIELITNGVKGEIILGEAKNNKGITISSIEVKTPSGIHYKTYADGKPAFIYADDFLRGPSAVLAKVTGLLNENEKGSKTAIKMHDIFMNQIAVDRESIIASILNKK